MKRIITMVLNDEEKESRIEIGERRTIITCGTNEMARGETPEQAFERLEALIAELQFMRDELKIQIKWINNHVGDDKRDDAGH